MNSDFIWVEKYRPKTIEDCILPESTKKTFQDFLNKGEIPNMLLAGPPGIGKTTVAKALCNELGVDVYVINGSDEGRFLDTVRNNAKNFASTVSLSSDAKRKFRIAQIENEGNDPLETGKSYGTPHDLASLYGRGRYEATNVPLGYDEDAELGRPEEKVTDKNTQDNAFGKDRIGSTLQ